MKKFPLMLALIALGAFVAAGCGGDDEGSDEGAGTTATEATTDTGAGTSDDDSAGGGSGGAAVEVAADPGGSLAFTTSSLTAAAGKTTFEFTNDSSTPHDFRVEDSGGSEIGGTDVIAADSTSAELDLEAGEYTFYCSVGGHREAGMEGTLTVE